MMRLCFVRRHFVATTIIVVVFLCGVLVWQFPQPILTSVANLWAVSDDLRGPADAIIVLGGGAENRPQAAADLYRRGFAPKILVSNSKLSGAVWLGIERPEAEVDKELLIKLGVPVSAISSFGFDLRNTYEEARAVLAWAKTVQAKRVIVPVEWYFSRRARWTFRRELSPSGIDVQIQKLQSIDQKTTDWWHKEDGVVLLQNEILKYVYYRLRY
jgi:uncharacterized SAM-binding protein YcdF (DUF218 family)